MAAFCFIFAAQRNQFVLLHLPEFPWTSQIPIDFPSFFTFHPHRARSPAPPLPCKPLWRPTCWHGYWWWPWGWQRCFTRSWNWRPGSGGFTVEISSVTSWGCIDYTWVNYNDLTATSLESWLVRGIIPKWPYFRFVKYYNLPRYINIYLGKL